MRKLGPALKIKLKRRALSREWRRLLRLRRRSPRQRRSLFRRNTLATPDVERFEDACNGILPMPLGERVLIDHHGRRRRCVALEAPADFRFTESPEAVLRFIYELRRQAFIKRRIRTRSRKQRPGLYVDLDPIVRVDIEGALMLAAEFDRTRRILGFKPMLHDHGWNPSVRAILHALGLYGVIEAKRARTQVPIFDVQSELAEMGLSIVQFLSDSEADGQQALKLREALYAACEPPGAARRPVYDALIEAFTNAVMHAYPDEVRGDGLPRVKRWWAGALIDKGSGHFYLVVYDQGVGIPATLPHRDFWALLSGQLPELTDAAVIKGALDYGRSGSGESGRGNGLWRMCELTNAFEFADVTFTSLKGQVTYTKGGKLEQATLGTRFSGTMIVWRAKVGSEGSRHEPCLRS